jgi:hypothetical protein
LRLKRGDAPIRGASLFFCLGMTGGKIVKTARLRSN